MLTRHSFLVGVLLGAGCALVLTAALAVAGAFPTDPLGRPPAPVIAVWDTHGYDDRTRWSLIRSEEHTLDSVRHLRITNGRIRIAYAGSPAAPGQFRVAPLRPGGARPLPRLLDAEASFDPGPATVELANNQEVAASFRYRNQRFTVDLRAGLSGYRVRSNLASGGSTPSVPRFPLAAFTPPFVVTDGVDVPASASLLAEPASIPMGIGTGYALATGRSGQLLFVASQRPAAIAIDPDRAGFATVAAVEPGHPELDLFIGLMDARLEDGPVWEPSELRYARPSQAGSYLELARTRNRWMIRSRDLRQNEQPPVPEPAPDLMALIPAGGSPLGLADLTGQAGSAFGSE